MKLRKLLLIPILSLAVAGLTIVPAWAVDAGAPVPTNLSEPTPTSEIAEPALPAPTFSSEEIGNDAGIFWFGKNLLYAGNNVSVDQVSRGLLFAAGNNLKLNSQSEYADIAGNTVTFDAATEKDLFAAGKTITIAKNAKVGRDVFAGAQTISIEADIPGDVSLAAKHVILKDATIKGNVNLGAETITFQGQVKIDGTLSYNDDAEVSGLTNVKCSKLETYTPETYTITAGEIWLSKMMSVVGLFVTFAIILLVFPRTNQAIAREANVQRFGIDLMFGFGFMIIVPLLSLLFLFSFFAISTSIFLIGVYCLIFYLAKAFVGAWLGHVIVEKLCHCTLPMLVEALIGILLITCAGMIPGFSFLVATLTLILGAGLIIACLRGDKKSPEDKQVYFTNSEKSSSAENATTSPGSNQKKLTTKSASRSTTRSAKTSSAKPATKTTAKPTTKTASKSSPKKTATKASKSKK